MNNPTSTIDTLKSHSFFTIKAANIYYCYIPYLIITFCVFIDLLNGLIVLLLKYGFTIGVYYRSFLTIILLFFCIKSKSNLTYYVLITLMLFIISNLVWVMNEPYYNFLFEVKIWGRCLYTVLILNYLMAMKDGINRHQLMKLAISYGVLASCSILFSWITGFGIATYGKEQAFGVTSFFEGPNDLSIVLILCLLLSFYFFIHGHNNKYLLYSILITAGAFLLGTRAGMVISVLLWFIVAISLLFFRFRSSQIRIKRRLRIVFTTIILLVLSAILIINIVLQSQTMINKFTINAITGGAKGTRGDLVESAERIISKGNFGEQIFGHGSFGLWSKNYYYLLRKHKGKYLASYESDIKYRTIESDYIETYGCYGLFLGGFIILIPLYFTMLAISNFLRNLSFNNLILILGLIVVLSNAYYAGHVFNSPALGPPLAVYYFCIYQENINSRNRKRSTPWQLATN